MTEITLPKVRLGFARNLFEAEVRKSEKSGDYNEWSAELLISKEVQESPAFKNLLAACQQTAVDTFGGSKAKNAKLPFKRSHDNGNIPAGLEEGGVFSRASSRFKPKVVKRDNGVWRELTKDEESNIYSGCFVAAVVRVYATGGGDTGYPMRVQLGLSTLMKVADGDRLQQEVNLDEAFGGVVVEVDDSTSSATTQAPGVLELPSY